MLQFYGFNATISRKEKERRELPPGIIHPNSPWYQAGFAGQAGLPLWQSGLLLRWRGCPCGRQT